MCVLRIMFKLEKYRFSFIAGICAAGGSFFGKLPSYLSTQQFIECFPTATPTMEYLFVLTILRAFPLILMVICNVLNWRYFLKALQTSEQTLTATVLTAASNYMASYILAAFVYREPFTLMSTVGVGCILLGLIFLCGKAQQQEIQIDKQKVS